MKKWFVVAATIAAMFITGCTRADKSTKILADQGYTQIEITGYRWFSCSKDDSFATGFRALAPNTKSPVSGAVCEGWFKGATIRLD